MDSRSPLVPFLDLRAAYLELRDEIDGAVLRVLDSGWYVLGPEVRAFEAEFAAWSGASHCVGVASGLDALVLALRALDIGPGDEVIVPSNTYIATWLAVSHVGATPVPVEPDPATHIMCADGVERLISERTRAILPVHLYGQPADMSTISELARSHGLALVSDAAQAHGARFDATPVGGLGDIVCWSFYPSKNLGAHGDGGAVTTDSAQLAERVQTLRNYGSRQKYVNELRGMNSRLDEIQAAILRVKLRHLDEWNQRRRNVAGRYLEELTDCTGLTLPIGSNRDDAAWHLFVVRHPQRDRLQIELLEAGIETLIHYPIPPHRQAAYADQVGPLSLPVAESLADEVLSLPIGPHLTADQVSSVVRNVQRVCAELCAGE